MPQYPFGFLLLERYCWCYYYYYNNNEHRHAGIRLHTPASVHDSTAWAIQARRSTRPARAGRLPGPRPAARQPPIR